MGGVGYGAKLLHDEVKAGINPLGPSNKMILTTSPFTMNAIAGGGSIELCFITPNQWLGRIQVWRRFWTRSKKSWL